MSEFNSTVPTEKKKSKGGRPKGTTVPSTTTLTVVGLGEKKHYLKCLCSCGRTKEIYKSDVLLGRVKSCGCRQGGGTHRLTGNGIWMIWRGIVRRCVDPDSTGFHNYGGRGITVCSRWRGSPEAFYADMGDRPSKKHEVDRKDNNGGYWCGKENCSDCGPAERVSNCYWATKKENNRNRRDNTRLLYLGESLCLVEWAERFGVSYSCFYSMYKRHGDGVFRAMEKRRRG